MRFVPAGGLTRKAVLAALVLITVLAPARAASAHAEYLSSNPADGSVVEVAPTEVSIQYSEGVSVRPDGVRVLDSQGDRVDAGAATASGSDVTAPLEDGLDEGTYVVAWRAVSADGHPIRGSFSFSIGRETAVGDGVADKAFGGGDDRAYEQLDALLRALAYVTALGAAGYVLVGGALRLGSDPSPVGRGTTVAASVALVAIVMQVPLQGALATGQGLGAIGDPEVLKLSVAEGMGWAALLAGIGLLAIIITTGLPWQGAARRVAIVGACLAPLGFVVTGHTRSMTPAVVGVVADAAHVAAAAVWFGGLLAVVVAVRRRRADGDPLAAAEAIARFSGWAAISAAVLIAAGVVLGWLEVGGLKALTTTLYGRLLLAKVAGVAVILVAAAWNRFRLVPQVAAASLEEPPADDPAGWRSLIRNIRIETALIVGVLLVTAVLVNVTPAKASVDRGPVTMTAVLGEGTVDVTVDPAKVGRNDIHIYLFDADGRADDSFDTVELSLELPAMSVGPLEREPVSAGPGHFQLVATDLPLAGTWELTITVRPDRFTQQRATVAFPIE